MTCSGGDMRHVGRQCHMYYAYSRGVGSLMSCISLNLFLADMPAFPTMASISSNNCDVFWYAAYLCSSNQHQV